MEKFIPRLKKSDWFWLLALTLVYFLVTSLYLTRLPIFVDEALYLRWAQIAWKDATWRFISLTDGKQPLFMWFSIPFMKFIADPLVAGRLVSVVSGYFTALGMWYAGFLIKDKKMGFLAMIFGMLTPFLFFYNRFAVVEALLIAFGVWIYCLAYLLAKTLRLDIAMILGLTTGLGLLVKSPARFFFLLIPVAFILNLDQKGWRKKLPKFAILTLVSWFLAEAVNNIQRLSPWMHMIGQKNAFFVVPYSEIIAEPTRLINNFNDVFKWHTAYTTLPLLIVCIIGIAFMIKKEWQKGFLLLTWFTLPLAGVIAIARLFAPRYMVFTAPFLLIFAAYAVSSLKRKILLPAMALLLIIPAVLDFKLINNPNTFPYVPLDEGYVNGWSAGNGVRQISDFIYAEAQKQEEKVILGTEGTFGILPHGIELYTQGADGLDVIGFYPLSEIPPAALLEKASSGHPTYFVLNNTELDEVPPHLELVAKYKKAKDTWMKLFRVVP